ncbi:hypothetical protein CC86DRAFT_348410 [Ophiobolus disseminans]|uniref:DDE-1 domain-containing protein n=1 Tax=Ophiobolus disseminans TaxID=1469910 RepID=A0A6A7A222_9PLEO|nr:hypothetical protein CC86DRAFT_348410 [Ophiobolus disseminans]
MLRNYCMSIVTRFLSRYKIELKTHRVKGKDRTCYKANSLLKYELYFAYLHEKIQKYHLRASDIYNIDKKGFYLSRGKGLTRIFSRDFLERSSAIAKLQQSITVIITLLACICANGSALAPALIYQSASGSIQDT